MYCNRVDPRVEHWIQIIIKPLVHLGASNSRYIELALLPSLRLYWTVTYFKADLFDVSTAGIDEWYNLLVFLCTWPTTVLLFIFSNFVNLLSSRLLMLFGQRCVQRLWCFAWLYMPSLNFPLKSLLSALLYTQVRNWFWIFSARFLWGIPDGVHCSAF